jgi:hypothetical protein
MKLRQTRKTWRPPRFLRPSQASMGESRKWMNRRQEKESVYASERSDDGKRDMKGYFERALLEMA